MRDHSRHVEVSREEATGLLLDSCPTAQRTEMVTLESAYGRVLAVDAIARIDMPNCLTCCMDSVAVHWSDFENGMPDTAGWQRGCEWEFANTGVGMPEGYDTAIVIEHVVLSEDQSHISFTAAPSKPYAGTRPAGSKFKEGEVLARAGSVLTPLLLSHIASGNNAYVEVVAKPRVAFIPTGNELVRRGISIPQGKSVETNSLLLRGKIEAWGGEAIVCDIVPDDPKLIKEAILDACERADIVVINAGSSKGSDDWNIEMLEELGTVLYHETNHGPGHHSSGAIVNGTLIVGISGPPGGAAFTTDFYLYPVMRKWFGLPVEPAKVKAKLAQPFPAGRKKLDTPKGEVRPSIVSEGKEFFGIKQVFVKEGCGGLEVYPASSSHPDPVEANAANGYYAMSSLEETPKPGQIIEVELRP